MIKKDEIYDFLAVGIGPFNLGLAALSYPLDDLKGIFFDSREEFNWHPGMMIEGTHLQVPFMADLVTMADPTNPFSFLNYSKKKEKIYNFYIKEDFYLLREEYNLYCRWVISQMDNLHFGYAVLATEFLDGLSLYRVSVLNKKTNEIFTCLTKKLVIGTGHQPYVPACCKGITEKCHTAGYLPNKKEILAQDSVTIIGGGQSAAEIFSDLLDEMEEHNFELNWITRSPRFFPLEYAKLTLEMTSPEYVDYFHALPEEQRNKLNASQKMLYKGINFDLINEIYDKIYAKSLQKKLPIKIYTSSELKHAEKSVNDDSITLTFNHQEQEKAYHHKTDYLVLATGFVEEIPSFLSGIKHRIGWDKQKRYLVNRNYTVDEKGTDVFVQNAEQHTHSFVSPDLDMGAYRNAYIINEMMGKETYQIEKRVSFQDFGIPEAYFDSPVTEPSNLVEHE